MSMFNVLSGLPCLSFVVVVGVSFPLDKVEKRISVSSVEFRVEDYFDFVFELTFDFDRRRKWLYAVRNSVRGMRFEQHNVKYRVNMTEVGRKFELVCMA
jgi:hypothetical protein